MTQIDSSKITGYSAEGPEGDSQLVSKAGAAAVLSTPGDSVVSPKVAAYAVYRPLNSVDMVKQTAYAVLQDNTPSPSAGAGLALEGAITISGGVTISVS